MSNRGRSTLKKMNLSVLRIDIHWLITFMDSVWKSLFHDNIFSLLITKPCINCPLYNCTGSVQATSYRQRSFVKWIIFGGADLLYANQVSDTGVDVSIDAKTRCCYMETLLPNYIQYRSSFSTLFALQVHTHSDL